MNTNRTPADQQRVNARMREPKFLQHMLKLALTSPPATPMEVKAFLATASPEALVLIEELTGRTPSNVAHIDQRGKQDSEVIVAGLVGALLSMQPTITR